MSSQLHVAIKCAVLLLFASSALAGDDTPLKPLPEYRNTQAYSLMICDLEFRLEQGQADLANVGEAIDGRRADTGKCIDKQRAEAVSQFGAAVRTVKKPAAKEAMKSAHASFVAALEGIRPGHDERKMSYSARQRALRDRLNEAWGRFEIEQ